MRKSKRYNVLLFFLILFLSCQTFPQNNQSQFPSPVFETISSEDGLPENTVTCILQDYLGYLWLGTLNGLVRYDGYSMKIFQPDINDTNSISDGNIVSIFEDKSKSLWIGTENGLNRFDRDNETFKSFKYDPKNNRSINGNVIKCIYEDESEKFWVGTNWGLNLFDRDKQIFTQYYFRDSDLKLYGKSIPGYHYLIVNSLVEEPGTKDLLVGTSAAGLFRFGVKEKILSKYKFNSSMISDEKIGTIQSFYKSRDGKIWIASSNTLSRLDPPKKECKSYIDFFTIKQTKNERGTVIEDRFGLIWFGFWAPGKGVFNINPKTESSRQYKLFPEKQVGTDYNRIYSLYEDRSGIIWIGSWLSGLMKWDRRKYKFQVLENDPGNKNGISDSRVYNLIFDPKGYIWLATPKALDKFNFNTGEFQHFLINKENITENIYHFIIDKSGDIWMGGTLPDGLVKFSPADGSFRSYFNNPNDSLNLINKKIIYLFKDQLGFLWICTQFSGLFRYDIKRNKLKRYMHGPNDSSGLSDNRVNMIFEDSYGTLWIGTNLGGIEKFDRTSEKFTYSCLKTIMGIFEDKRKNFWVADYFSGLNLFDREKNKITATYSVKEGLAHNAIQGILEDDHENLWIGTDVGLSKFSINAKSFRNYTTADGLPANRFLWPCCKDADGVMYFKTERGIIYFHPDSIKDDPVSPKVVLSNVSLFNRPGEKLNYKGFISELKEIILHHDQNDLRFDYVGLHFSEPGKNKYKYILENFDRTWIDAETQRNATYTNLDPGEYVFRVLAANKDGIWNEQGASIKIIILPPWWATTWAYVIYALILINIIYFTWKLQLKRIRIKHNFEMSKFEAEKMHEVDEIKNRFFENISHEFRTPLTLIFGPATDVIEKTKESYTKKNVGIIKRNANRLYGLVNQLLDLSKLEAGKMKLEVCEQNIIPLLKGIFLSFSSFAERKKITLKFNTMEENLKVYIDRDKVEKIINNLLSNAFKFTPEGGNIDFTVDKKINKVEIKITDNGIGIPVNRIEKIFDRFYQVDSSHTREGEGTGIGLALTKELVELHKGNIKVKSKEGEGTTFCVQLPLGKDYFRQEEIVVKESEDMTESNTEDFELVTKSYRKKEKTEIEVLSGTNKSLLLIVEDNSDVRNYIISHLEEKYRIEEALNGEDGLEQALKHIPDLIISDVMMPKMDGFEMCNKIKTDERTSHVPIIMLTAKATIKDKIEGYETGADDYIMKPFDAKELRVRISNLLEQRKRLREHFRKQGVFELNDKTMTSVDKNFLIKVTEIIGNHISDTSFNIDIFSEEIGISRSQLHRKLVALVGEPPSELIRRIRLSNAAKLIDKKFGNISEIALEVGFSNPANFANSFRKQFGMSPSEYENRQ